MNLGNLGLVLAEIYRDGLTIEQGIEQRIAGPVAAVAPEPTIELPPLPAEAELATEAPAEDELAEEMPVVLSEAEDLSEAALPEAGEVLEES